MDKAVRARGEFKRFRNGLLYFAQVEATVDPTASQPTIRIEDVAGCEAWTRGAVAGVRHALWIAGQPEVAVTVHRITGTLPDTTPASVAAAAASAVWNSLAYRPRADVTFGLESVVFESFNQPADAVPDLPHGTSKGA